MPEVMNLPTKIYLEEYDGNVIKYFEAVYSIFKNDFVDNKPNFRGIRLGLKKYPLILDKEYTFYHMTHEGDIETERIPDFRRMERIRFPKIMIDKSTHPYLKVWRNQRTGTGGTKKKNSNLSRRRKLSSSISRHGQLYFTMDSISYNLQ